jgi:hypothetical protein
MEVAVEEPTRPGVAKRQQVRTPDSSAMVVKPASDAVSAASSFWRQ